MKARVVAFARERRDGVAERREQRRHPLPWTEMAGGVHDAAPFAERLVEDLARGGGDPECSLRRFCGVEQGDGIRQVPAEGAKDLSSEGAALGGAEVGADPREVL